MNSYYKMLNQKMCSDYKEDLINELRMELKNSVDKNDLHDFVTNRCDRKNNLSNLDINFILKCYILSQVMNDNDNDNSLGEKLIDTANSNIKKDSKNNYYKMTESGWEKCNITDVFENGNYVMENKRNIDSFKIQKIYNKENQLIEQRVIDSAGTNIDDKNIAAALLGLKREFRKKI